MVMTQSTASRSEKSQIIRITRNLQTQSRGSVYNEDPGPVQGTNQLFLLYLMETNVCREGRRDSVRIVRRKRDFLSISSPGEPSEARPDCHCCDVCDIWDCHDSPQCLSVSLSLFVCDLIWSLHFSSLGTLYLKDCAKRRL